MLTWLISLLLASAGAAAQDDARRQAAEPTPAPDFARPAQKILEAAEQRAPGAAVNPRTTLFRLGRQEREWSVWLLLLALPVLYVSIFAHEAGHALMARLTGARVTSFGLGLGRPFLVGSWGSARVYLAWTAPLQGLTFTVAPGAPPGPARQALMLAGGAGANAVLAALALALSLVLPWGGMFWGVVLLCNLLLVLGNLVPYQFRVGRFMLRSDGAQILQLLRGQPAAPSPPEVIAKLGQMRALWDAIGDRITLQAQLIETSGAWVELDDLEQAERLVHEAEARRPAGWPVLLAFEAVVRSGVHRLAGRHGAGAEALDEAEAGFRALEHDVGLFLVAWGRAELLLERGDAAAALERFEALEARIPAVLGNAGLGMLAARLCARAALADVSGTEALRTEYEARRQQQPSARRDRLVYRTLGRLHASRSEWEQAGAAYSAALRAARELHAQFATAEDRARYAELQVPLLAEAQASFAHLGDRAPPRQDLPSEADLEARRQTDADRRSRNLRRVGLGLVVLNGIAAALLIGWTISLNARATTPVFIELLPGQRRMLRPPQTALEYVAQLPLITSGRLGAHASFLLLMTLVGSFLALAYGAVLSLVGRWRPALRRYLGSGMVYLALTPWLGWLGWQLIVML